MAGRKCNYTSPDLFGQLIVSKGPFHQHWINTDTNMDT